MRQPIAIRRKAGPLRGVLDNHTADRSRSTHARYHPSPELALWVEHYWSVAWDYRGVEAERVEILPHPSVHMTFDTRGSRIMGIVRGRFTRHLRGRGGVFGVKFTPAGFHPFLLAPVATLADTRIALRRVFGDAGVALAHAMRVATTDPARVAVVDTFLLERRPPPDPDVERLTGLVYEVAADRSIVRVDDLARRCGTKRRTLERLFAKYVGVSPKWVIQRYRLHEAAEQLAAGTTSHADLAAALGYADQAHFIHDFRGMVGCSPAAYAKTASR
jgi:AraC-like DNA-binding protein